MRVGLDARFLTHPQRGGFKTYTRWLVAGLAAVDCDNEYTLYVDRPLEHAVPELEGLPENFRIQRVDGTAPVVGMAWREQVLLARAARRDRLDLFHAPALTAPQAAGCPLVLTVHDMLWRRRAPATREPLSLQRRMMALYYDQVTERSAKRATALITVSHHAAGEIRTAMPEVAPRLHVVYEAAAPFFGPVADARAMLDLRHKLPRAFILAIGGADPLKNIDALLAAFAALPVELRRTFPLVLVWTHGLLAENMAALVQSLGVMDEVHFLQGVDDETLRALYNACTVFIFPSRREGFGLPLLEAMACGSAVLAAHNTSIPEVAGNAALYFDAGDVTSITNTMGAALLDSALRDRLRSAGVQQAARFSWDRCARETIEVYRLAAKSGQRR